MNGEWIRDGSRKSDVLFLESLYLDFTFGTVLQCNCNMAFPFENLEVYKQSIQFVSEIQNLIEREGKRLNRSINDQLSRASLSIPLNIAEGNGRWHKAEKRNYFWIARGSCFECVPIIEVLKIKGHVTPEEREEFRARLESIGKMLTKLVQAHSE